MKEELVQMIIRRDSYIASSVNNATFKCSIDKLSCCRDVLAC